MKVFLDDERETPLGWTRTYTVRETIDLLETGLVTSLSLDNDLGEGQAEGRSVLNWIEQEVALGHLTSIPEIKFHTSNLVARRYMEVTLVSIKRLLA